MSSVPVLFFLARPAVFLCLVVIRALRRAGPTLQGRGPSTTLALFRPPPDACRPRGGVRDTLPGGDRSPEAA